MGDLLGLIMKVAADNKPYVTHIAYINPDDGNGRDIVSLWAGSGVGADPVKRIEELVAENRKLKSLLGSSDKNKTEKGIWKEAIQAMVILGAESDLLSIVCSKGDTLTDDELLWNLKDWNESNKSPIK